VLVTVNIEPSAVVALVFAKAEACEMATAPSFTTVKFVVAGETYNARRFFDWIRCTAVVGGTTKLTSAAASPGCGLAVAPGGATIPAVGLEFGPPPQAPRLRLSNAPTAMRRTCDRPTFLAFINDRTLM
jgi:hypothetical protein